MPRVVFVLKVWLQSRLGDHAECLTADSLTCTYLAALTYPKRLALIAFFSAYEERGQVPEGKEMRYFLRRSPPRSAPRLCNK